jgi:hypothetical protein
MDTNKLKAVLLKKCVEESFNYANVGPQDGQEHWYEKNMKKEFKDVCDAVRENQEHGDNYQLAKLKSGVGGPAAAAYEAVCKLLDGKTYYENQDGSNSGERDREGRFYLLNDMIEPVFCPLIYHMIREPKQIMTTKTECDKIEEQFVLHRLYDHQEEFCDLIDECIISDMEIEVHCEITKSKFEIVQDMYEELPFQIQKVMYNFEHLVDEEEEEIIFSKTFTDKDGNDCKGEIIKFYTFCPNIDSKDEVMNKKRKL